MSSPAINVAPDASFSDAVAVMAQRNIGNLVVMEGGEPAGILTEREILRYLSLRKELPAIPVRQVALQKFVKVAADAGIADAARTMIAKKARLLVFEKCEGRKERLAGIITASDIVRAFLETAKNPSLKGAFSRKVYSLHPDRTILAAVKLMHKSRIGSVVIEKDGRPYGIFTERDLLGKVLPLQVDLEEKVSKYCTRQVVTARLRTGARAAGKLMLANRIKRLPLTSKGRIAGIVTARDLVYAFQRDL